MEDEKEYWLDKPSSANIIFWGLCIVCALFIAPDLFLHKHGHFSWEDWTGFYGVYGFVSCVGLVLVATQLRKILQRPETYYE
jgi:hypothetical protein